MERLLLGIRRSGHSGGILNCALTRRRYNPFLIRHFSFMANVIGVDGTKNEYDKDELEIVEVRYKGVTYRLGDTVSTVGPDVEHPKKRDG